jgi:hypothetical protein
MRVAEGAGADALLGAEGPGAQAGGAAYDVVGEEQSGDRRGDGGLTGSAGGVAGEEVALDMWIRDAHI